MSSAALILGQVVDAMFRNTLAPWQWGLLAAIPLAIVALYFLKIKRQPLEVPSTYLWHKSIEDLHVNSFWQRMRKNLLMFLQLLMLAIAALALLRPGWEGTELTGDRFIFLIDNSASMQAADTEASATRLESAKANTRALIDQMESGMTAMIISFSNTPHVVQEFTDNRRLLRERLEAIEPSFAATDLKSALELADGLANPGRVMVEQEGIEVDVVESQAATLFIFSDGRFEDVQGFSLGNLQPIYIPIGSLVAENVAITGLATQRSETRIDGHQALVQVTNFTTAPQKLTVELQVDGQFLDAQQTEVASEGSSAIIFPLADASAGVLSARLNYTLSDGQSQDVLVLDDRAAAVLNASEPGSVLVVTPGSTALETALATQRSDRLAKIRYVKPSYLDTDAYKQEAEIGAFDLFIFDLCLPETMPRGNTIFLGYLPPDPAWQTTGIKTDASSAEEIEYEPTRADSPQIIAWNRAHPILAHVELGNVLVADSLLTEPPAGGDVLIDSTAGPIAAIAPRGSFQDVVVGFGLVGLNEGGEIEPKTNWPVRASFPTFWLNALEYLASSSTHSGGSLRPGEPMEVKIPGNIAELVFTNPAGKSTTVRDNGFGTFQYHDTDEPGIYKVEHQGELVRRFAVNLFDAQESNVRLVPSQATEKSTSAADIQIGNVSVAAMAGQTPARKEMWRILLIGALLVLLVEWYIYNRRVYV